MAASFFFEAPKGSPEHYRAPACMAHMDDRNRALALVMTMPDSPRAAPAHAMPKTHPHNL